MPVSWEAAQRTASGKMARGLGRERKQLTKRLEQANVNKNKIGEAIVSGSAMGGGGGLESQLSDKFSATSQLSVKISANFSAIIKFCRSQLSVKKQASFLSCYNLTNF